MGFAESGKVFYAVGMDGMPSFAERLAKLPWLMESITAFHLNNGRPPTRKEQAAIWSDGKSKGFPPPEVKAKKPKPEDAKPKENPRTSPRLIEPGKKRRF